MKWPVALDMRRRSCGKPRMVLVWMDYSISWLIIARLSARRLLSLLLMQVMMLPMNNAV